MKIIQGMKQIKDLDGAFEATPQPPPAPSAISEELLWPLLGTGNFYLDPPDGGDVPLIEQLRRMSEDAAKWRAAPSALRYRDPTIEDVTNMAVSKCAYHLPFGCAGTEQIRKGVLAALNAIGAKMEDKT